KTEKNLIILQRLAVNRSLLNLFQGFQRPSGKALRGFSQVLKTNLAFENQGFYHIVQRMFAFALVLYFFIKIAKYERSLCRRATDGVTFAQCFRFFGTRCQTVKDKL